MKKTFTGNTRLFLCISGAIIVIALVMQIAGAGLNLGIDFTGGSILNYSVGEDYDVSDVETLLNASGYTDNQITKAAPSAASIALQERLAAEAAETVEAVAEAAAEDPEVAAAVDEAVEEAAVEAAVEEAVEEAETPVLGLLNPDKSGIVHDGLTDLQIRLKLVDEAAGMEECLKGLETGDISLLNAHAQNALEQVSIPMRPEIETARRALQAQGAAFARMTGSGSVVFGAFQDQKTAKRAWNALRKQYAVCLLTSTAV